ncbi:MAG: hypothetical protein LQ347_003566 [Umbilicaria vellea]|nr:MAG: hypothetical protein LQ347_003566 [Umbilicaria vellea]
MPRTTLVKPPPVDPSKSPIENVLDLTTLVDIGPVSSRSLPRLLQSLVNLIRSLLFSGQDIFTNTRPLWHPPGARGIYGGAVIAQTLAAAQHTIPSNFVIHSMHCYFVLAGDASIPILYHVERVREGKSFATRTVQARQRGRCIFTTTASFVREGSGGEKTVSHELDLPEGALEALEREEGEKPLEEEGEQGNGPFVSMRLGTTNSEYSALFRKRECSARHLLPIVAAKDL